MATAFFDAVRFAGVPDLDAFVGFEELAGVAPARVDPLRPVTFRRRAFAFASASRRSFPIIPFLRRAFVPALVHVPLAQPGPEVVTTRA